MPSDSPTPQLQPIAEIGAKLGLTETDLVPYGHTKAKVRLNVLEKHPPKGKLILVSADRKSVV